MAQIPKQPGRWLCPSTRAFLQEANETPSVSRLDFLHGYIYSRWPYLYIAIGVGEHPLAGLFNRIIRLVAALAGSSRSGGSGRSGTAEVFHGKVLTNEGARQLLTVREEIRLTDLEQVIPYRAARDIILKHPDHIVALRCPCRSSRPTPCTPLDVCLVVGEPFAGFIAEHHPDRSRWIDSEEACQILHDEHLRGHVHHAFFKDAMLGRFYAICNCCRCCCGAMQANRHGTPLLASSGYASVIDLDLCTGCGHCVERCPFSAMELLDGVAWVDREACLGCGICATTCDLEAATLVRDPSKPAPLEIRTLMDQAAAAASTDSLFDDRRKSLEAAGLSSWSRPPDSKRPGHSGRAPCDAY